MPCNGFSRASSAIANIGWFFSAMQTSSCNVFVPPDEDWFPQSWNTLRGVLYYSHTTCARVAGYMPVSFLRLSQFSSLDVFSWRWHCSATPKTTQIRSVGSLIACTVVVPWHKVCDVRPPPPPCDSSASPRRRQDELQVYARAELEVCVHIAGKGSVARQMGSVWQAMRLRMGKAFRRGQQEISTKKKNSRRHAAWGEQL